MLLVPIVTYEIIANLLSFSPGGVAGLAVTEIAGGGKRCRAETIGRTAGS
jgi:hypothetical protein